MTIAAGFTCTDGLLVCSDSEMTYSSHKAQDPKVEFVKRDDIRIISAGSGDAHLMRHVWQECQKRISHQMSFADAEAEIQAILEEVHNRFIYPVSHEVDKRPNIDMVFGVWTPQTRSLLQSYGASLVRVTSEAIIGFGSEFGRSVFHRLAWDKHNIHVVQAAFLAVGMLKETKDNVQSCGGNNHILALSHTGKIHVLWESEPIEEFFRRFDVVLRPLLSGAANVTMTDAEFAKEVEQLGTLLEGFRTEDVMKSFRGAFNNGAGF